jgi:hypothetical protein
MGNTGIDSALGSTTYDGFQEVWLMLGRTCAWVMDEFNAICILMEAPKVTLNIGCLCCMIIEDCAKTKCRFATILNL